MTYICFGDLYLENKYSFWQSFIHFEAVTARLEIIKGPGRKMEADYFGETN